MSGHQIGGLGLGAFAILLGAGGIFAALRTRKRRAEIATTYGSTGGPIYTGVQIGCSGILILGGLGVMALGLLGVR